MISRRDAMKSAIGAVAAGVIPAHFLAAVEKPAEPRLADFFMSPEVVDYDRRRQAVTEVMRRADAYLSHYLSFLRTSDGEWDLDRDLDMTFAYCSMGVNWDETWRLRQEGYVPPILRDSRFVGAVHRLGMLDIPDNNGFYLVAQSKCGLKFYTDRDYWYIVSQRSGRLPDSSVATYARFQFGPPDDFPLISKICYGNAYLCFEVTCPQGLVGPIRNGFVADMEVAGVDLAPLYEWRANARRGDQYVVTTRHHGEYEIERTDWAKVVWHWTDAAWVASDDVWLNLTIHQDS
jgi:hypothetical protein